MKMIKALLVVLMVSFSVQAFALEGEDQVAYSEALGSGDLKVVKKYLDAGLNPNEEFFAWSQLETAATKGQVGVAKLLLERGANINHQHIITKMSALHMAAYENYPELVKFLVSKGADINLKLRGNVSIVRAIRDQGNIKMMELLLSLGAKDDGCQDTCF